MIGVPAGLTKAGGISSGAGAETTTLAKQAGEKGGSAAQAFREGRQASSLDISDDLDNMVRAVDRQAKQAFGAGKTAIDTQPINKVGLKKSFADWKKATLHLMENKILLHQKNRKYLIKQISS